MLRHIHKTLTPAVIALTAMTLESCDSTIYDKPGDCDPAYALSFKFTKNVLNADAFGPQVTDIHIAVYDQDGSLFFTQADHRTPTEENSYRMPVDLRPGTYDIIAWCYGPAMTPDAVPFSLRGQAAYDHISTSGAFFTPEGNLSAGHSFSSDLVPLFYGRAEGIECLASDYGDITLEPIALTKDTNSITVMLQNLGGQPLDADLLEFAISADNSELDWRNELTASETKFDYRPWDTTPIKAESSDVESSDMPDGVKTEFTTSRLFANHEQRLTVTRKDTGETVIDIPLIEYLLLVRSNYQQAVSPQDYLDRVDTYSLVFFIGDDYEWIKSRVIINGWRVVPPQTGVIS